MNCVAITPLAAHRGNLHVHALFLRRLKTFTSTGCSPVAVENSKNYGGTCKLWSDYESNVHAWSVSPRFMLEDPRSTTCKCLLRT